MIRAAVMVSPGAPIEIRALPEPGIEPGAVLLETVLSEVCGTAGWRACRTRSCPDTCRWVESRRRGGQ